MIGENAEKNRFKLNEERKADVPKKLSKDGRISVKDLYNMGEKRFFAYYDKAYVDDLIKKTGFRIKQFFMQGGETGDKWLFYVVVKD